MQGGGAQCHQRRARHSTSLPLPHKRGGQGQGEEEGGRPGRIKEGRQMHAPLHPSDTVVEGFHPPKFKTVQ